MAKTVALALMTLSRVRPRASIQEQPHSLQYAALLLNAALAPPVPDQGYQTSCHERREVDQLHPEGHNILVVLRSTLGCELNVNRALLLCQHLLCTRTYGFSLPLEEHLHSFSC